VRRYVSFFFIVKCKHTEAMIQNDGMCTILAIILVLMLFSSGMREWMKTGDLRYLGSNVERPRVPNSENCGCNANVAQTHPPSETYASARKSEQNTLSTTTEDSKTTESKDTNGTNNNIGDPTEKDSHSMDALKRNLAASHKYRHDLTQCRTDHIGRSQGARTGFLHVLTDSENRSGKHKADEFTTFQPFFMAPESRTNPTNYRGSVDLPLSESMFE